MQEQNKQANKEKRTILVTEGGQRIDAWLAAMYPDLSRSRLQAMIKDGGVTVEGQVVKPSYVTVNGDEVTLWVEEPKQLQVQAQELPLTIAYEDADLIVVDKPQGMVVHPAVGHYEHTLVNALLHHCKDLSGINGIIRPGIVHRIDKDTSGLLVVAKNDQAHNRLAETWKKHDIKRIYYAVVHGIVSEPGGVIDAAIGRHPRQRTKMAVEPKTGRSAVTNYKVLERFANFTLLQLQLETGRTHQIRVHMAYLGHPVAGDPVYGPKKSKLPLNGQALHAKILGFPHPITGQYVEFESPLPAYFEQFLGFLRTNRE